MSHSVTITTEPASGPGALAGFAIHCTCGDVQTTSLEGMVSTLAAAHLAWHRRNG